MNIKKISAAALIAVAAAVTVTGCSSTSAAPASAPAVQGPAAPSTGQQQETPMLIDVRTPAEYAAGHLDGAVNIDFQDPSFQTQIEALDKNGNYSLYCHSGNRSGQAYTYMTNIGFTHLTDLHGIDEASQTTGIPVVS